MRKKDFTADFSAIKNMCSKIRNINEAMSYADEYDDDQAQAQQGAGQQQGGMPQGFNPQGEEDDSQIQGYGQGQAQDSGMDYSQMQDGYQDAGYSDEEDGEEQELDAESNDPDSPVNQIREIALKGMVALCKTPDDPQYEVLKKIFQFCDKANDKKKDEDKD